MDHIDDSVGPEVVAAYFREHDAPEAVIPDLLERCPVGSTSVYWNDVLNEWRKRRNLPPTMGK
jgi:hypothetical protein